MTERKPIFGFHNPTAEADAFKNTPEQNRFFDLFQILEKGLAEGEQILLEIPWSLASPEERESSKFPSCIFCKRAIFPSTTKLTTIYNKLILSIQTWFFWNTNWILLMQTWILKNANLMTGTLEFSVFQFWPFLDRCFGFCTKKLRFIGSGDYCGLGGFCFLSLSLFSFRQK